ncbi:radical SAM protein [Micromonospora sp. B11E3]|uniref:radical SAM protein n=1 Tax=Micromonospora sp. B11E3 TaxID=3153562 RepID=UPI00325EA9BE
MEERPENVVWDITYACPLRCVHCYSESGRRPSRQLKQADLLRVTDALVELRPRSVVLAGGEPLLVKEIFDIVARLRQARIGAIVYTSGWGITPEVADRLMRSFHQVIVSIDGATAEVHDTIRRRPGSFASAMNALAQLDSAARKILTERPYAARLGIEYAVLQSNSGQLDDMCRVVAPQFPRLGFLAFGAAVPSGLASRVGFDRKELLTDAEVQLLVDPDRVRRLQALAPTTVAVSTTDNLSLLMRPDLVAAGRAASIMQVEPDGAVRAMPIYEGTVGTLLEEPAQLLWQRAVARWSDPFVRRTLAPVRTMSDWAEATRLLDRHFGSAEVRARIDRRPAL